MPLQDVKESKDYHFPTEEEAILKFWTEVDAFQEQLRRTAGKPEYSFYDGPPFATGLPHYGHILAGTLKACMLPPPPPPEPAGSANLLLLAGHALALDW